MQDLNVTLIQCTLAWEDPETNLSYFDRCFERLTKQTDLVVLPEMFTTGFSMNAPELAIGDGAMGFWAALEEVFSETRQQRCLFRRPLGVHARTSVDDLHHA